MSAAPLPGEAVQLDFLNKLQRILGEGSFVASYKYALILAIAELSVEKSAARDGTLVVPLRELSERFISLYWRQAAPFKANAVLAQNRGRQASVITSIAQFRARAHTLAAASRHRGWPALVGRTARLLKTMPLWRLQLVGADRLDFFYEEKLVDGAIVLKPGIADCFKQQFGIVEALVQMAWIGFIQKLPPNREMLGSTGDLTEFMFGSERTALGAIIEGLTDVQESRCFYCGRCLNDRTEVDHFIPWSRYPRDLGHNFVLAHGICNQQKSDMLAASGHLARWAERNDRESATLSEIFTAARFMHDADASFSVTEWAYEQAERAGSQVWVRGRETSPLAPNWREDFRR